MIEDTIGEVILKTIDNKKEEVVLGRDDNLEETVIQEIEGKREEVTQGIVDMRRRMALRKERYRRNSVMMNKKSIIVISKPKNKNRFITLKMRFEILWMYCLVVQLSLQSIRGIHCSQL